MNQILDKNYTSRSKITVEFSNAIAEIPYIETKKFKLKKDNYKIQFFISSIIATLGCFIFLLNLIKSHSQEKISKKLLNNYNLTTLYQTETPSFQQSSNVPFIIGIIKIDKIDLNYPILSQTNDDLLKVSVCRFAGPMPNEVGNLCIVGHNYIDTRFFSRLDELLNGDEIKIYDLNGNNIVYEVYNKYEVNSNDLTCTNQNVNNKKIVTLITCDNINGLKRLIIHAKQKSKKF